MANKGQKSLRGKGQLYDHIKLPTTVSLTPVARQQLDALARSFNLSRSELIEQIARGVIQVKGKNDDR